MISTRLILTLTIIIMLTASIILLYISNQGYPATTTPITVNTSTSPWNTSSGQAEIKTLTNTTGDEDNTYKLAIKEVERILEEARDIYLNALSRNETWAILIREPYSNLSRMFILDTTIIDETTLLINHTAYRYLVVHVYDAESKTSFMPQRIQVDSMIVELLPRNNTVTYTGGVIYDYIVSYRGRSFRASFTSIGFVEASYYLTVSTSRISDNIYKVEITVASGLGSTAYISKAWLILARYG